MISRRVNAERLVLLGWARAILLQMAHPLIAAGVAEHSHFRAGPLVAVQRLRETVRAMLALTFGDPLEHGRAIAGIRAIHTRVRGRLIVDVGPFPAGTTYSAEDPALVLWVHATVVESVVLVYERLFGQLSPQERDEYCEESRPVAVALGADEAEVPRTWVDLEAYLAREHASGRLVVGSDAQTIINHVLFPPLALVSGPAAWVNRVVTLGLLPPAIRDQYGYGWSRRRDRQLGRTLALLRSARRLMPRVLAWWPAARASAPKG